MVSLSDQSGEFAEEIQQLLSDCFKGNHEVRSIPGAGDRFVVQPYSPDETNAAIQLCVNEEPLVSLSFTHYLDKDHREQYLKATKSDIHVSSILDSTPLFRMEYRHDMSKAPTAHWQVHGERGALSHLLAHAWQKNRRKHPKPHAMSSLHLPVGGERFRPAMEDLLQFLIEECGVDRKDTWQRAVTSGRVRWRERQLASAVRDAPAIAANALTQLGYTIQPPKQGEPTPRIEKLRAW